MLLVPVRQYVLPKFFKGAHRQDLDAAEYEEAPADQDPQARNTNIDGVEILDEMITRSRGEIRHTQSPKITSSTPGSVEDIKSSYNPCLSQRAYSPRAGELRVDQSPRFSGKGVELKQNPSPGPSNLGQSSHGSSSC
uniref:Uncharacterized protein n=1 Tax=Populus alba TaxID=43335 RepID=A0A4U5MIY6_POPAL|nr:hypothetical protein D5086_0000309230 [Populus alba]